MNSPNLNTAESQESKSPVQMRVNRDLSEQENYSGRALKKGEIVYLFRGCTYGCISAEGVAVSFEPDLGPFFEVPEDSISPVTDEPQKQAASAPVQQPKVRKGSAWFTETEYYRYLLVANDESDVYADGPKMAVNKRTGACDGFDAHSAFKVSDENVTELVPVSQVEPLLSALKKCDTAFAAWQVGQIPGRPEDILALISEVREAIRNEEAQQ